MCGYNLHALEGVGKGRVEENHAIRGKRKEEGKERRGLHGHLSRISERAHIHIGHGERDPKAFNWRNFTLNLARLETLGKHFILCTVLICIVLCAHEECWVFVPPCINDLPPIFMSPGEMGEGASLPPMQRRGGKGERVLNSIFYRVFSLSLFVLTSASRPRRRRRRSQCPKLHFPSNKKS